jgi:tRNA(Ile)-lysidine synthase
LHDQIELLGRCTFPPAGTEVTCAVSGGADSLSLLVLAVIAGCRVTAIHVDHGQRPGSGAEADVVAAAARRFGAAFRAERVEVSPGPNLEARLRKARYGVLPTDVLTGHTADDQAETVVLHLLRGSGLTGLAGMRRAGHPLLGLRRRETVALCADLGLVPVDDPTNTSPNHRRNRIRHELLPLADAIAQRDVAAVLARAAGVVRDDDDLLEQLASALDPTDARALAAAPRALARRAVRRWLAPALGGHPPDLDAVERVLAVAEGRATGCDVLHGMRVERRNQQLRVVPPWSGLPER